MEKECTYVIDISFICGHIFCKEKVINVKVGETTKALKESDSDTLLRVQSLTFKYDDEKVSPEDVEAYTKVSVYDKASMFMKELKKNADEYIGKWDNYTSDRHAHSNISGDNNIEYNKAAYTKK